VQSRCVRSRPGPYAGFCFDRDHWPGDNAPTLPPTRARRRRRARHRTHMSSSRCSPIAEQTAAAMPMTRAHRALSPTAWVNGDEARATAALQMADDGRLAQHHPFDINLPVKCGCPRGATCAVASWAMPACNARAHGRRRVEATLRPHQHNAPMKLQDCMFGSAPVSFALSPRTKHAISPATPEVCGARPCRRPRQNLSPTRLGVFSRRGTRPAPETQSRSVELDEDPPGPTNHSIAENFMASGERARDHAGVIMARSRGSTDTRSPGLSAPTIGDLPIPLGDVRSRCLAGRPRSIALQ